MVMVPVPVVKVLPLMVLGVIAPSVKAKAPAVFTAETPLPVVTEETKVPEVGRVTEVAPVVESVSAFVGEKVTTSPPPSVMALVARVVLSELVKVVPAPKVSVPVPVVKVLPLMVVAVAAPKMGETNVGVLAKTTAPLPVSSVSAPAKLAEVNEPSEVVLPTEVTAPERLASVVTVPALPETLPVTLPVKAPEKVAAVTVPVPALMLLLLVTIPFVQVPLMEMAVVPVPVLFR